MTSPKFTIGQVIQHRKFDYRGVIIDVDPFFSGTDEWYDQVAKSRPPKDAPWYTVLVDNATHVTYVAERHLAPDESGQQISHPALGQFFDSFEKGRYAKRSLH